MPDEPSPPGDYPVVVVGGGPGGVQLSYFLRRLGIDHGLLSEDLEPGGMFRRFPLFERLITWTKPQAPAERGSRAYERYDWNSLLGEEPGERALVAEVMDGSSYFPTRTEMATGHTRFVERAGVAIRSGCRWEGTERRDDGFVVRTSDREYTCRVLVLAVGVTRAWKPEVPGLDLVPHYVETGPAERYLGKRVFIIGKRNSGFEVADALLPKARSIVLASPRPARISVLTRSTAAARARYLQPYEDHVLGGGTLVLDAAIERVERRADGYRVVAQGTTRPGAFTFETDAVIAATGFATPLLDLPGLGVATFHQGRLPVQTPFWESATVPGIYFAGSITQGSVGLRRYGIPSNSAAVHGFRYNARVLAEHLARIRFGVHRPPRPVAPGAVLDLLLQELTEGPELWNQQSYLSRVLAADPSRGIVDQGVVPLAHFVDEAGPDAVAVTIETDDRGEIHPEVYVRRGGAVREHALDPHPLHDYRTEEHRRRLASLLPATLGGGPT